MSNPRLFAHRPPMSHPLAVAVLACLIAAAAAPALAGSSCVMLDADGNPIGNGGANAGADLGGNTDSLACGRGADASQGAQGTAIGANASTRTGGVALGVRAVASGNFNTAIGHNATAAGLFNNTAVGASAYADNFNTVALGRQTRATGIGATATGARAEASGDFSAAYGGIRVLLSGENVSDPGRTTRATGFGANAFGSAAHADGRESASFGFNSRVIAGADRSVALGAQSVAGQADVVSLGHAATDPSYLGDAFGSELNRRLIHLADGVDATDAVNLRQLNVAVADAGSPYLDVNAAETDIGTADAQAGGSGSLAIGSNAMANTAGGHYGTALGAGSQAQGFSSIAIGPSATTKVNAFGAVAIGLNSVANENNVVSFGHAAGDTVLLAGNGGRTITFPSEQTRRLIHVGAGSADTDAVNLAQLRALGGALGGGAGFTGGVFNAPGYSIQGASYRDVGAAFAAVDNRLTLLGQQAGTPGPAGPTGPQGPQGPTGPQGPGNPLSAAYDGADQSTLTLQGAAGTTISNLAAGTAATDAVNKGQMDAADAGTLQSANSYARSSSASTLQSANAYTDSRVTRLNDDFVVLRRDVDQRFGEIDRRLDRMGAMSGAMSAAAMNTAGLAGANRVGVGVGSQSGQSAIAVGYQRLVNSRTSVSLSAGFSGDESTLSAGAGFSW